MIDSEFAAAEARALRGLTYILMVAGVVIVLPFPLVALLNVIFRIAPSSVFAPGALLAGILAVGHLVLLLPILTISISALWVYKVTEDHAVKFSVFKRGFMRFLPVAVVALAQMVITVKNNLTFLPLGFGILLLIYAGWLLKLDRLGGNPE